MYSHLTKRQAQALDRAFRAWSRAAPNDWVAARRARYLLTFLVLANTGARIGEAVTLRPEDIDPDNAELSMVTLKQRNTRPEKPRRLVAVNPEVIDALSRFVEQSPELADRPLGVDPANFRKVFRQRCAEAGIPPALSHPHVLRHTHVIDLLRKGVPITMAQDRVGHSRLETTRAYARFSGAEAREILREKGVI